MLNNYRFKKILGSGEFGTVYKAIWRQEDKDSDTHTEKEVAVKTVDKDVGQEEIVKFLQEAAIMGQFNHPSIVKILGIVVEDPVSVEPINNAGIVCQLISLSLSFSLSLPPLPPLCLLSAFSFTTPIH